MSGRDREPLTPAYLRGVLTVGAELSDGSIGPDGWMLTQQYLARSRGAVLR